MGAGKDQMACAVDEGAFLDGIGTPQQEDQMLAAFVQAADDGIGELFPAMSLMAAGLVGPDGEHGVEQQHALMCPTGEVAAGGDGRTGLLLDFLEDVLQGWGEGHAVIYRKAKAVGLTLVVIGVLSQYDHFYIVKGCGMKGIEDEAARRVAGSGGIFRTHKLYQLLEVGLLKLRRELCLPALFYLYVHIIYYNKV